MTDPRLDRRIQYDPRSRNFAIREVVGDRPLRGYTWAVKDRPRLDQGREGACVGFGWTGELLDRPKPYHGLDDSFANLVYHEAQQLDEWPGDDYEGTSVLAGAKVLQARGLIAEYRWAFSLDDVLRALGHAGPVVMGTWWWSGMFDPDPDGFVRPTGSREGGHCYELYGTTSGRRTQFVRLVNSWGAGWGQNGTALISWDDLDRLLHDEGEACIPLGRAKQVITS
jgi:hypothetical protein